MLLGELPFFRKLLPEKESKVCNRPLLGGNIPLENLEVVQCFHVSFRCKRESILTYGLIPKGKPHCEIIYYEPRIFVSTTYEEAAFDYVNFESVDVWTFYIKKEYLFLDEFSDFANHYYIKVNVPWYKLQLFESK